MNRVKQSFNNKTLTRTKVTNNIIRCYANTSSSQRHDWYKDAYQFCNSLAVKHKKPTIKIAGIVSALSPMKSWSQNKILAEQFLEGRRSGTFKSNIDKCEKILSSTSCTETDIKEILNGNKTKAFFENIYNYKTSTTITVDRHAIEIAVNYAMEEKLKSINDSQYAFFKDCYKRAAEKLDLRPSMVQSATWVYWREIRKGLPVVRKE